MAKYNCIFMNSLIILHHIKLRPKWRPFTDIIQDNGRQVNELLDEFQTEHGERQPRARLRVEEFAWASI